MRSKKQPARRHRTKNGELRAEWCLASFAGEKCPRCGMFKQSQKALCRFDLMKLPTPIYLALVSAPPKSHAYREALLTALTYEAGA